ncbi:MAG: ACT domain-containing protein, partial [Gemmataceae bacterium]
HSDASFAKYPRLPVWHCTGYQVAYTLELLSERFAVCRLEPGAAFPEWAIGAFCSITRTPEELSVVCPEAVVPENVRSEPGWRCLHVVGKFDFAVVGMIASLTGPLAAAGISVFVLSTFDTDYVLVKDSDLGRAVETLEAAGNRVGR